MPLKTMAARSILLIIPGLPTISIGPAKGVNRSRPTERPAKTFCAGLPSCLPSRGRGDGSHYLANQFEPVRRLDKARPLSPLAGLDVGISLTASYRRRACYRCGCGLENPAFFHRPL